MVAEHFVTFNIPVEPAAPGGVYLLAGAGLWIMLRVMLRIVLWVMLWVVL